MRTISAGAMKGGLQTPAPPLSSRPGRLPFSQFPLMQVSLAHHARQAAR